MTRANRFDKRTIAVVLLVAAVIVAVGGISSYAAKYAHKETDEKTTTSEAFYFTSDLLTEDGSKTYDLPVGTNSITFELRNYADDLRWSDSDITYEYSVNGGTATSGKISRADDKGTSNTVTISDLTADTYTVTATSTSSYATTLSATFKIAAADTKVYSSVADSENSPYATLTIYTKDYEGDVTVSWPSEVIPDEAQNILSTQSTFRMDKFSSCTFRFFKNNLSANYSGDSSAIKATVPAN